mmetsp:Transcript_33240/g.103603  ORF Transcript_33240/g.103603 Transcript_33240/m.103603 type:complete len:250 (+) Transcript_33240:142-891(+)
MSIKYRKLLMRDDVCALPLQQPSKRARRSAAGGGLCLPLLLLLLLCKHVVGHERLGSQPRLARLRRDPAQRGPVAGTHRVLQSLVNLAEPPARAALRAAVEGDGLVEGCLLDPRVPACHARLMASSRPEMWTSPAMAAWSWWAACALQSSTSLLSMILPRRAIACLVCWTSPAARAFAMARRSPSGLPEWHAATSDASASASLACRDSKHVDPTAPPHSAPAASFRSGPPCPELASSTFRLAAIHINSA